MTIHARLAISNVMMILVPVWLCSSRWRSSWENGLSWTAGCHQMYWTVLSTLFPWGYPWTVGK